MRRFLVASAVLLGLVAAIGCGKKGDERLKVGFIVKMPEEKWFQDEWKYAQQAADKHNVELIKIGAPTGEEVISKIDNLGANGAQGLVICTPDVKLGPAIVARAAKNGMKLFSVDDQFVGSDGKPMDVPYMGISAPAIGESVGKALYAEFKKRGWKPGETAACGVTFEELNTARERTEGAERALVAAGFPKDRIFKTGERTTDIPGARDAASTLLTQHPEVKRWLVFSMNDEGVLGAVRAMENRGLKADSVVGIGIGGSSAFPEFKKPEPTGFVATVMLDPYRHGYETTEWMIKWIREGVAPASDTRTSGTLVDRGNYAKIAAERGMK